MADIVRTSFYQGKNQDAEKEGHQVEEKLFHMASKKYELED